VLLALAAIVALPVIRFAAHKLGGAVPIDRSSQEWRAREALVARGRVFVSSSPATTGVDLSRPPGDPDPVSADTVECRYVPGPARATTPKFDCALPSGEVLRVKYGRSPELPAETAATRLLGALGFAADRITMVRRVRCIGCPPWPYHLRFFFDHFFAGSLVDLLAEDSYPRDFDWVAVERKFPGRAIEVGEYEGWEWHELSRVSESAGGATRAEVDAFRIMAVFLAHWDNKAQNQRLVCDGETGDKDATAPCDRPLLMMQDVGGTFGPTKVDFQRWSTTPIWSEAATCSVSLESMPFQGATFEPVQISEGGRSLIAGRLRQLSDAQIRTMFESARFPDPVTGAIPGDVTKWVEAFQDKVRQIADRPPCPALPQ
jgi:hypothetical protein